jgi:pSer/pThr/pTyr-binding forkhead associated (FHA) protein
MMRRVACHTPRVGGLRAMLEPLAPHSASASELKERLEVERAGVSFLVYRDGGRRQRILPLAGERVTVGRGPGADLRITWDDEVSRTHAQLERVGGAWTVSDDGLSRNGTFCNDERVRGRRRLEDADQLRFGHTLVAFRAPEIEGTATTALASEAPGIALTDTQRRVLVALCKPLRDSAYATPATNQTIAGEVFLGVDAVKVHLRALYRKLGIGDLPQNEKRARLVELAFHHGLVDDRDLGG